MLRLSTTAELLVRKVIVSGWGVLAALTVFPAQVQAQDERVRCSATGSFFFRFAESVNGSMVTHSFGEVDIRPADMEVAASNKWQAHANASTMRTTCAQAALCFAQQAAGAETCVGSTPDVLYEVIRKPDAMDEWRRQVACSHARAGNVGKLRRTNANTVTLVETRISASAGKGKSSGDGYATVSESGHVCWTPPPPERTDSDHRPSRTNAPSPITDIQVTVTPPEQKGKCPASVLMQARLELREPADVRWWVTGEDGYESPKNVRSITRSEATLIWRRHIDPTPTAGGLTQKPGAKPGAPIHRGYFQVHFETVSDRSIPLGTSGRIPFIVDCSPVPANRLKR